MNELTPINKNKVTCLTLTLNPFVREVPLGCDYLNCNHKFSNEAGLLAALKLSSKLITTENMFIYVTTMIQYLQSYQILTQACCMVIFILHI